MVETGVGAEELKIADRWGLDEWVGSLVAILYPSEQVEDRYVHIRSS